MYQFTKQKTKLDLVRDQLRKDDYAVVSAFDETLFDRASGGDRQTIESSIVQIVRELGMGQIFVPDLYKENIDKNYTNGAKFNYVGGPAINSSHPAFSVSDALEMHVDGSLNDPGEVKYSLLGCVSPAHEGGDNLLFLTSRLFEDLVASNRLNLSPMLNQSALRRHSTVSKEKQYKDGPVFLRANGGYISRYCITPRDEWKFERVKGLREAKVDFEASITNAYIKRVSLRRGEILIMNNMRISHARETYKNSLKQVRFMIRALVK